MIRIIYPIKTNFNLLLLVLEQK